MMKIGFTNRENRVVETLGYYNGDEWFTIEIRKVVADYSVVKLPAYEAWICMDSYPLAKPCCGCGDTIEEVKEYVMENIDDEIADLVELIDAVDLM